MADKGQVMPTANGTVTIVIKGAERIMEVRVKADPDPADWAEAREIMGRLTDGKIAETRSDGPDVEVHVLRLS